MAEFTADLRSALQGARDEALAFGHGHVDAAHLLLSVVRHPADTSAALFNTLGVDPTTVSRATESALQKHHAPPVSDIGFPYTSTAKQALESAMTEARQLGHQDVGPEHLLLGLVRVGSAEEAAILTAAGVTLDRTRSALMQLHPATPQHARPSHRSWMVSLPISFVLPLSLLISLLALAVAIAALFLALRR